MSGSYDHCLFDTDPVTRSVQTFHYLDETDQVVIQNTQDVEPIVDRAKVIWDAQQEQKSSKGEFHFVGSITYEDWQELRRLGITRDPKAFAKWWNDPARRKFCVGRI